MPTLSIAERVAVNENRFVSINEKIDKIDFKLDRIVDAMPEITRKVEAHHAVFHQHIEQLRNIQEHAKFGSGPRPSDGNGGYLERRAKEPITKKFRELPWWKKLSFIIVALPFFFSYGDWILARFHMILNWIEVILK
jgi:hypothetical protein